MGLGRWVAKGGKSWRGSVGLLLGMVAMSVMRSVRESRRFRRRDVAWEIDGNYNHVSQVKTSLYHRRKNWWLAGRRSCCSYDLPV